MKERVVIIIIVALSPSPFCLSLLTLGIDCLFLCLEIWVYPKNITTVRHSSFWPSGVESAPYLYDFVAKTLGGLNRVTAGAMGLASAFRHFSDVLRITQIP